MAERKSRRRQVYGLHAARAVLGRRPESIVSATILETETNNDLIRLAHALRGLAVPVVHAARSVLDGRAKGGVHQGVILEIQSVMRFSLTDFEELVARRDRDLRLLILDGVEDPRNLGACLRTADAAGVDAVVVPRSRTPELTSAALKAATGAAESMPLLFAGNLARTLRWLKQAGVWLVGTDAAAPQSLHAAKLQTPIAIVVGGEGRGLRRLTRDLCDELVAIPMAGTVESLNVSVAAGVALFELARQLGERKDPHTARFGPGA
jgi:23S rRNA (guanosine2251-2'-O)-methyltransferase